MSYGITSGGLSRMRELAVESDMEFAQVEVIRKLKCVADIVRVLGPPSKTVSHGPEWNRYLFNDTWNSIKLVVTEEKDVLR
ncbi:MAG: hypothetical protein N2C14_13210, partial [Planctomycetales bacterium]